MKYVYPSVKETAFNCPHCGALAKQFWRTAYAKQNPKDDVPFICSKEKVLEINLENVRAEAERTKLLRELQRLSLGVPFFKSKREYSDFILQNVFISSCYNCDHPSVWIYDRLIYPIQGDAPEASSDLPEDILRDYKEASTILNASPRGAAALIRLAIQKLCIELGQPGKNINNDIGALVSNGLDSKIQKALDAVRGIGNNAVHPGQIDLKDNRQTAETLFRLLNIIAEKMISEPKHVDEIYNSLPESALAAIKLRDEKP